MSVSVVIPAYNAAKWIALTIDCVRRQEPAPAEIIVVDDGSVDETVSQIRSTAEGVTLLTQKNQGASVARNRGLEIVSTEYVYFLDADDYVEQSFFGAATAVLTQDQADIAFCPVILERPDGSRRRVFHYENIPEPLTIFQYWLNRYSQPPCSIVWRTEFIREIGGWNEGVSLNDDGELMMRAMLSRPILTSFSNANGVYRAHNEPSLSKLRSKVALESELAALRCLVDDARSRGAVSDFSGFGNEIYSISRAFFEMGEADLGRRALSHARQLGLRGHPGSPTHRVLASVLGLENKSRLAGHMRRIMEN